ncbi:hypothetical protein GmHk_10G028899 [Glycine max]|nr:hypothetical protein GmHk_10G028899 [Glycine max]
MAFFSSSSPILLESSIQYPWGVGLHHPLHLGKDLTSNLEVHHSLGLGSSSSMDSFASWKINGDIMEKEEREETPLQG